MNKPMEASQDDGDDHLEIPPDDGKSGKQAGFLILPALDEFIGIIEIDNAVQSLIDNGLAENILILIYPESYEHLTKKPPHAIIIPKYDPDGIMRAVEEFRRTRQIEYIGVLGIDDEAGFGLSDMLKKQFQFPHHKKFTLQSSTNKALLKMRFDEAGIPSARYSLSGLDGKPGLTSFPNVTKLVTGTGSEFSFVSADESEWSGQIRALRARLAVRDNDLRLRKLRFRHASRLFKIDPRREFLMEEFIGGKEYSMDFIVNNRRIEILRVTKKYFSPFFGYFLGYYLLNEDALKKEGLSLPALKTLCGRIAVSLRITKGIAMTDFKLNSGGLFVIEASVRPGLSVFIDLMQKLLGWTSFVPWASLLLKKPFKRPFPKETGLSYHIYAPRAGRIKEFDLSGLEKLKKRLGIFSIYQYDKPGDIIEDSPDNHYGLFIGYILIKNPDPAKIDEIFQTISRAVKIVVEPAAPPEKRVMKNDAR